MTFLEETPIDVYLAECYEHAALSPDPSTQVGAIAIAENGLMIGSGFNAIPEKFEVDYDEIDRDTKLALTVHAEASALINASGQVHTLFCSWYACEGCASAIALAGVKRVVGHQLMRDFAIEHNPSWNESTMRALDLLKMAGVSCEWYHDPLPDAPSVRVGGQVFDPSQTRLDLYVA